MYNADLLVISFPGSNIGRFVFVPVLDFVVIDFHVQFIGLKSLRQV